LAQDPIKLTSVLKLKKNANKEKEENIKDELTQLETDEKKIKMKEKMN